VDDGQTRDFERLALLAFGGESPLLDRSFPQHQTQGRTGTGTSKSFFPPVDFFGGFIRPVIKPRGRDPPHESPLLGDLGLVVAFRDPRLFADLRKSSCNSDRLPARSFQSRPDANVSERGIFPLPPDYPLSGVSRSLLFVPKNRDGPFPPYDIPNRKGFLFCLRSYRDPLTSQFSFDPITSPLTTGGFFPPGFMSLPCRGTGGVRPDEIRTVGGLLEGPCKKLSLPRSGL